MLRGVRDVTERHWNEVIVDVVEPNRGVTINNNNIDNDNNKNHVILGESRVKKWIVIRVVRLPHLQGESGASHINGTCWMVARLD